MLNKVTLIGRLGKTPELKYSSPGGTPAQAQKATDYILNRKLNQDEE